jgi:hypothetical protein
MTGKPYNDFFLQHLDFAIEYISLHYPFTEDQVLENMPYLNKGDAFYSEYERDICSTVCPEIGLCFNQNIQWTLALKRLWKVGYEIVLPDCCSGNGGYYFPAIDQNVVWGDVSPEILFDIIPLYVYKELWDRHSLNAEYYQGWDSGVSDELLEDVVYSKLSLQELYDLFQRDRTIVLFNDSIWQYTIKDVLTFELVEQVLAAHKKLCTQA